METKKIVPGMVKRMPDGPGIYVFRDKNSTPIYVGKAKNLKARLGSYFATTLAPKTAQMVANAVFLSFIKVDSELSALLLEANLVKKYMPKYNSALKDDKSPIYIVVTREHYPRVLSVRKTRLDELPVKHVYGPFPDGKTVRQVLKLLRRAFPFCQQKLGKRACMYSQIGLCDPCPSAVEQLADEIEKQQKRAHYLRNIKLVRRVLAGKLPSVIRSLKRDMARLSSREDYEGATRIRNQIALLTFAAERGDPSELYIEDPNLLSDIRGREGRDLARLLAPHLAVPSLTRIECFDIAHLSGTNPTASMVTFVDGEPDKRFYRHFKVSRTRQNNDYESMKSVIKRRAKHFEDWGMPDLIIVDGGKPQVSAALEALDGAVPVIGAAKRQEQLVIPVHNSFVQLRLTDRPALHLIARLRDEAHRFARRYHHKLVAQALRESGKAS